MARKESSAATHGLKLDAHQVLLRPLISEKNTHLAERHNTYVFEVHPLANKGEIKAAVQEL
ncbi:MAG: 50S ribosomal protein L23, partial [Planctomycetia bacterium]